MKSTASASGLGGGVHEEVAERDKGQEEMEVGEERARRCEPRVGGYDGEYARVVRDGEAWGG